MTSQAAVNFYRSLPVNTLEAKIVEMAGKIAIFGSNDSRRSLAAAILVAVESRSGVDGECTEDWNERYCRREVLPMARRLVAIA